MPTPTPARVRLGATAHDAAIELPAIGQGSWFLGEGLAPRRDEVRALQLGLERGLTLVDTAEMYADGGAEEIVGEALAGRREAAFLVSKVYPWNAGRDSAIAACEASLRRLKTDYLDLYLLHWPGNIPLEETLEAFERLRTAGKIRRFGVSNFDVDEMAALHALPGGSDCAVNQVLYHLGSRGSSIRCCPGSASRASPPWPTARWPRPAGCAATCSATPRSGRWPANAASPRRSCCWPGRFGPWRRSAT